MWFQGSLCKHAQICCVPLAPPSLCVLASLLAVLVTGSQTSASVLHQEVVGSHMPSSSCANAATAYHPHTCTMVL
jgi:hypothetical protein